MYDKTPNYNKIYKFINSFRKEVSNFNVSKMVEFFNIEQATKFTILRLEDEIRFEITINNQEITIVVLGGYRDNLYFRCSKDTKTNKLKLK